jgi:hypothetical protein
LRADADYIERRSSCISAFSQNSMMQSQLKLSMQCHSGSTRNRGSWT